MTTAGAREAHSSKKAGKTTDSGRQPSETDPSPPVGQRRALIVLGMHRSGTSALTRLLSLSGARLPSNLLPAEDGLPNDGNTKAGFWESRSLMLLHEEALESAGSRWDDLCDVPTSWFDSDIAEHFIDRLVTALEVEFEDAPLFVAKDPRISRLAPIWDRALQKMEVEANWVISVRNPLDVAASLNRRDGFPRAKGLLLWLGHILAAERYTRHQKRLFVSFEDLLEDWQKVAVRIEDQLEISFPRKSFRAAAEIDNFLNIGLRHHCSTPADLAANKAVPAWVKDVFHWTYQSAAGEPVDAKHLEEIERALRQTEAFYGPVLAAAEQENLKRCDRETRTTEEIENLKQTVANYEQQLGQQQLYERQTAEEIENLRQIVADYERQLQEKQRYKMLTAEEIDHLNKTIAQGQQQIEKVANELSRLNNEVVSLKKKQSGRVKTLAFYLPQYHPIPENDAWWGKGFTEWANVTQATPNFQGHTQPLLPGELGFYDLRIPDVRAQQAALAREYGISGFCYYYYWFHGRKLLERPLEEVLESGEPDFPFCICWANENWTRRWDGEDHEILIEQGHSLENDARFIDDVLPALLDPRYITRNGKPLLLVYRADLLTDPVATAAIWREKAKRAGLPGLHLCSVWRVEDPLAIGFDAAIEFPPHHFHFEKITDDQEKTVDGFEGEIFDYAAGVGAVRPLHDKEFPVYRGVMPSWDNTARRGQRAWCFAGSTPELYGEWLQAVVQESADRPGEDDQFVFINAWNEWAEGAVLEPSRAQGRAYLEATRAALERGQAQPGLSRVERRLHDRHERLGDQLKKLGDQLEEFDGRQEERAGATDQSLKAQQAALHWLRGLCETLGSGSADLENKIGELRGGLSSAHGSSNRQLFEVKSRLENKPSRDLWLSSAYGLTGLLLKLPFWVVSGRVGSRLRWWRNARRIRRSGLFSPDYYLERYPEIAGTGADPLYHFVRYGAAESRDPNPYFNSRQYQERFPESTKSGGNPLLHYLDHGAWVTDMAESEQVHSPGIKSSPAAEESPPQEAPPQEKPPREKPPKKAPIPPGAVRWTLNQDQLANRTNATTFMLFVSHDAARAGSQLYLLEVLKSFSRVPNLELYLLLRRGGELRAEFERYAHVLDMEEHSANSEASVVIEAVQALARPPAVALCNTVASGAVAKILHGLDLPVVSIVHELPTTIDSLGEQTFRDIVASSKRVIIVSKFVKSALVERYGVPADQLQVLYVGVIGWQPEVESREAARRKIFAACNLPDDAVLVLGCGSIHHRKGPDLFVQVARTVSLDHGLDRVHFLWVGGDEQGPLFRSWCEHDIAAFGLQDRVVFAGQQENTADYYLAADAFLLTSREDPFPLVNLEALARGLPIIAFEGAGGAPEALEDEAGIVVPYLDTAEMARALVRLVEAPRYHAAIREKALSRAREKFLWERFIGELHDVLLGSDERLGSDVRRSSTVQAGKSTDDQAHMELLAEFFQGQTGNNRSQRDFSALAEFNFDKSDEFWIWCLTTGRSRDRRLNDLLPGSVEASIQERYTGQSGESTFQQALGFKEICISQLEKRGSSLSPQSQFLDFGCGWGRISLTFLNRVRPENLFAVDVSEDAVSTCRQSGLPGDIRKIDPAPPLPFGDNTFDMIVSYSVFSHLSEDHFVKWAHEFHRILKPGGFACLTTRPRDAIQWFKDLRESGDVPSFAKGAAQSFVNSDAAFRDYDSGKFCFAPEKVPHIGDFYGESCIPLSFLEKHLKELFAEIDMVLFSEHELFDQNLIVLKK